MKNVECSMENEERVRAAAAERLRDEPSGITRPSSLLPHAVTARPHLFGMLPADLATFLRERGVAIRDDESRRILAHAITRGRAGFPVERPVPKRVEAALEELTDRRPIEILERATDPSDGFVKYLFRLHDGALAEAVRIPLEKKDHFSVCLSSQAGCAMGCLFCATGRMGLQRHLEAWEIVAQFVAVRDEAPGRVSGAVFQGQGEPLHNFDAVAQTARVLSHSCGGAISGSAITISTVGLVPGILKLANDPPPWRLIVSFTSAIDAKRRALIPTGGAWSVEEIAGAVRSYQRAVGGRVTIAWVLLGGVNHGQDEVDALRRVFDGVPLRFNLIDVNDARPDGFRRATDAEREAFRDALQVLGAPVVRRYSGGVARHAACGMLASTRTIA
jgi:23S rRNA (adenine2503-C2)-methyltransferase